MLKKGALERVDQPSLGFYSLLFLVQKATGGWKPIIDLFTLNSYVTLTNLWMETVALVLGSIWKDDWMFSNDLKGTYFQISIHPESRLYLQFVVEDQVFQFQALSFGLSTDLHQGFLPDI